MIRPFSLSSLKQPLRFIAFAFAFTLAGFAVIRTGVWATGSPTLFPDLIVPPQITEWQMDNPDFGGMSALIMAPDGGSLIAGSDRGSLVWADVIRDTQGQITTIENAALTRIRMLRDRPLTRFRSDFEALTPDPEGGFFTAFEGYTRIEHLDQPGAMPVRTHKWDRFTPLFGNQAFEALATLPDGRLLAIIETIKIAGPAPSLIYDGTTWADGPLIPVDPDFAITGADVGPDGCLYLVERRFSLAAGFRFRLRRLSGGPGAWTDTMLYASAPASQGNAESISVWQQGDQLVLSVLTDDGFLPLPPTQLMEFRVRPGTGCTLAI